MRKMRCRATRVSKWPLGRSLTVAVRLLIGAAWGLAGEANVDGLVKEFLGAEPAAQRTPEQLEVAHSQVLDAFLPKMGSENPGDRQGPEQTFQEICWKAGRPGAEANRLAVSRVIVSRLKPSLPRPAQVWLLKQLERIGRGEAVECLAGFLADRDEWVRECARRALQNNPAPEATATLLKALDAAEAAPWRVGLMNALGYRRDAAAVKSLIKQAGDADDEVRSAALRALAQIGEPSTSLGPGKAAADAITAGMTKGADRAKAIATDSYLLLADKLAAKDDKATALAMYRKFLDAKGHLRCAAIVGIGRAGGVKELDTIFEALGDPDVTVRGSALQALGLLPAREVNQAMIAKLKAAAPEMKVMLLQALARGGDKESLPAFVAAASDPNEGVRIAAYEGMGMLRNEEAASVLVPAVVKATDKELAAAKTAINLIPGGAMTTALIKAMDAAAPSGRVQLIQCLGARRTTAVVPALLKAAEDSDASVRTEALKAVADVADEKALPAVAKLLVNAKGDAERQAAEGTVVALARRIEDAEKRTEPVTAALPGASVPARLSVLRVLGRLGGAKALEAVRAALKDASPEVQDAAFRALPNWIEPSVATELLAIAKSDEKLPRRVLALRGAVDVIGKLSGQSPDEMLKLYESAMAAAQRPEDKKMVLGGMGGVANLGALELAQRYMDDPALKDEAEVAVVQIARALSGSYQAKAKDILKKLMATSKNERVRKEAGEAMDLLEKFEDYITAWHVSGPYKMADKDGPGLFDVVFPPEKPADPTAKWRPMPIGTDKGRPWLIEFDKTPGLQGNDACVYLRTRVQSPKKQEAQLQAGSDDGIKIWLNGKVVHANNATRPISPGSDKAKVTLNEGWNDLLLKITQGGGEWSACLRIRAAGGGKLDGLTADPAGK